MEQRDVVVLPQPISEQKHHYVVSRWPQSALKRASRKCIKSPVDFLQEFDQCCAKYTTTSLGVGDEPKRRDPETGMLSIDVARRQMKCAKKHLAKLPQTMSRVLQRQRSGWKVTNSNTGHTVAVLEVDPDSDTEYPTKSTASETSSAEEEDEEEEDIPKILVRQVAAAPMTSPYHHETKHYRVDIGRTHPLETSTAAPQSRRRSQSYEYLHAPQERERQLEVAVHHSPSATVNEGLHIRGGRSPSQDVNAVNNRPCAVHIPSQRQTNYIYVTSQTPVIQGVHGVGRRQQPPGRLPPTTLLREGYPHNFETAQPEQPYRSYTGHPPGTQDDVVYTVPSSQWNPAQSVTPPLSPPPPPDAGLQFSETEKVSLGTESPSRPPASTSELFHDEDVSQPKEFFDKATNTERRQAETQGHFQTTAQIPFAPGQQPPTYLYTPKDAQSGATVSYVVSPLPVQMGHPSSSARMSDPPTRQRRRRPQAIVQTQPPPILPPSIVYRERKTARKKKPVAIRKWEVFAVPQHRN